MERLTSKNPLTERGAMNLSLTDLYMRLKSYEDLEEEGRLLVLPCKVGTIVWVITTSYTYGEVGDPPEARRRIDRRIFTLPMFYSYGKTVFLTREAAEAKLKEVDK